MFRPRGLYFSRHFDLSGLCFSALSAGCFRSLTRTQRRSPRVPALSPPLRQPSARPVQRRAPCVLRVFRPAFSPSLPYGHAKPEASRLGNLERSHRARTLALGGPAVCRQGASFRVCRPQSSPAAWWCSRRARGGCWTFTRGCVPFNDAEISRNVQYAKRTALTRSTLYTLSMHSEN